MKLKIIGLVGVIFLSIASKKANDFFLSYPDYFPKPSYNFSYNPLDSAKVDLGRLLFFDPILSKDNSISCASCHSPYNAFAHTDHDLSHGINDQIGIRNAPALFNLAWQRSFMWDGAINHLDMQALAPISSTTEMGESIENVVDKISKENFYKKKFHQIYKDDLITGERLLKVLSQFQLTLVSANSKYDQVKRKEQEFTIQERKGYEIFKKNCNSCHNEPLFSTYAFETNYLGIDPTLNDYGKGAVSSVQADSLKFKIPSLRNLSYSFPYMHDGRFKRLNQLVNHYTDSLVQLAFEDDPNKTSIRLNSNEKTDLTSFLLTLNDKEFVFNPKHQFPKALLNKTKEEHY